MLRHPVNKVSYRSLIAEPSTYLFMGFSALIVSLFMVLTGVGKAQSGDLFAGDDRILIVSNKVAPRYPLPVRYVDRINEAQLAGVERAVAINFVPATMNGERKRIAAMAADPAGLLRTNTDLVVLGSMGQSWIDDRNSVLVGRDFAEREGLRVGDTIAVSSPVLRVAGGEGTLKLRIRGLYSVRNDAYPATGVLMHDKLIRPDGQLTVAQGASAILVLLRDRVDAPTVSREIDALHESAPVGTRTTLREQFVETFNSQGAGVSALLRMYGFGGIAAGLMLLLTFCYFNAQRMGLEMRRFEEIGFSRAGIVMRAATSMTLVILAGALGGLGLTLLVSTLFDVAIRRSFPYFSPSLEAGVLMLPEVVASTFLLSALALTVVLVMRARAHSPEDTK